jgi:DNA-binding NarL/FixJ family response regulator
MRLIVADDSALFRRGMERLLSEVDFSVIGQAASPDELMQLVERDPPDVSILDIRMPPTFTDEGLRAAREIRRRWPAVGLLLLSQYAEPAYAADVLALGTRGVGYLLKDRVADVDELADALRRIARGGSAFDREVVGLLMERPQKEAALDPLTERERAVLALMAEGRSNEAISEQLFLSPKTVETHVGKVFSKLGLEPARADHRRVMAVLMFLRS